MFKTINKFRENPYEIVLMILIKTKKNMKFPNFGSFLLIMEMNLFRGKGIRRNRQNLNSNCS